MHATIDTYIASFPDNAAAALSEIRQSIHRAVPLATETISYGIPTFQINGKNMVHFGAYANHIGFYATPDGQAEFEAELNNYKRGKGSVQFPLNESMPLDLIRRMAIFREKMLNKA